MGNGDGSWDQRFERAFNDWEFDLAVNQRFKSFVERKGHY